MLFAAGRSVMGQTKQTNKKRKKKKEKLSPKTEGTVFPNTDWPRPVNNVVFFPLRYCSFESNFCIEFYSVQIWRTRAFDISGAKSDAVCSESLIVDSVLNVYILSCFPP